MHLHYLNSYRSVSLHLNLSPSSPFTFLHLSPSSLIPSIEMDRDWREIGGRLEADEREFEADGGRQKKVEGYVERRIQLARDGER